jgi:hypothetical protein
MKYARSRIVNTYDAQSPVPRSLDPLRRARGDVMTDKGPMASSCGPAGLTSSNNDVTADGQRFLMIKDDDQDSAISTQVVVVLAWADEVSARR